MESAWNSLTSTTRGAIHRPSAGATSTAAYLRWDASFASARFHSRDRERHLATAAWLVPLVTLAATRSVEMELSVAPSIGPRSPPSMSHWQLDASCARASEQIWSMTVLLKLSTLAP